MYKEWVTNDDKDCSIIPIKLKGYRKKQSYRNKYFVIIVYIICCFNNKKDHFIIINFHINLQAACVLDQKSLEISSRRGGGGGGDLGVPAINHQTAIFVAASPR